MTSANREQLTWVREVHARHHAEHAADAQGRITGEALDLFKPDSTIRTSCATIA
jgi:hypothetical protein